MNLFSSRINIIILSIFMMASCKVSKKDFDPNNIEWKDIESEWGVPLVNSTLTLSDVVSKNKTPVIVEYDPNDDNFISLVYLDTVRSPTGEELLKNFVTEIPLDVPNTLGTGGASFINNAPVGQTYGLNLPVATWPIQMAEVKNIAEIKLKGGQLLVEATSYVRHDVTLRLKFPEIISDVGDTLKLEVNLNHKANVQVTNVGPTSINLDGYLIKTSVPNQLKYQVTALIKVLNNDNPSVARNPAFDTDSLNFRLNFKNLSYKYVKGEFNAFPLTADTLEGETRFNVFNNVRTGYVKFTRPQVDFNFLNSFGTKFSTYIDRSQMFYAYDTTKESIHAQNLNAFGSSGLNLPGTTTFNGPTVDQMGTAVSTKITLDKSNSTLTDVLTGAPYKFNFRIPQIRLEPNVGMGFISDDSHIEIQTKVQIPLELRVRDIVIADTIKNLDLPNPKLVEYVEFKAGSHNSIPFSIEMQTVFLDSVEQIIDSLIVPPYSPLIVAPGTPIVFDANNPNVIKQTTATSNQTVVRVDKARYTRLSRAKKMVVIGRAYTIDATANPEKSVKFYAWQTCTFLLAVKAKLRIDITDPEASFNVEKQ